MKIVSAEFEKSATMLAGCPLPTLPEFAFIGRSNVGKSSLINMLTNKQKLARVSKTPGRTREINFFSINEAWRLVDLPGYGFAKVSKAQREEFNIFVSEYLLQRESLCGTFVLIDSRLEPQRLDLEFIRWLVERELPFALVFTKTDKKKVGQVRKHIALFIDTMKEWSEGEPIWFTSSAMTRDGRKEILSFITEAIQKTT